MRQKQGKLRKNTLWKLNQKAVDHSFQKIYHVPWSAVIGKLGPQARQIGARQIWIFFKFPLSSDSLDIERWAGEYNEQCATWIGFRTTWVDFDVALSGNSQNVPLHIYVVPFHIHIHVWVKTIRMMKKNNSLSEINSLLNVITRLWRLVGVDVNQVNLKMTSVREGCTKKWKNTVFLHIFV